MAEIALEATLDASSSAASEAHVFNFGLTQFRFATKVSALAILTIAALVAVSLPLTAGARAQAFTPHGELVSTNPADFTPAVLDGKVTAIAPVGPDLVIVGGNFTQVRDASGVTMNLPYIFAFRRSTGLIETGFDPQLNNEVTSLVAGTDGASVYVGGFFTIVNGATNKKGLTKLDLAGDRITQFTGRTNARVKDLALVNDVLYVAGTFTKIKSTPVELLAAVDPTTGEFLPGLDLDFADEFSTIRTTGTLSVDKIDVSSDGSTLVALGNFGTINGQDRDRLAVIDVSAPSATLSPWRTTIYANQCGSLKPQYVTDVDISPDDSYLVVVSSGGYGGGDLSCDTASRFELTPSADDVQPTWSTYSGGDTFLAMSISDEAVYVGGHFRWLNNPFVAGQFGPGGVPRLGFAALDPLNGLPLSYRSDRSPRGIGTYEVLVADDGVWIGDDTDNMNFEYRPRLKFLPLAGDGPVQRPSEPELPTTVFDVTGTSLSGANFDGSSFDTPSTLATGGWDSTRGMMFLGGAFFYGSTDGNFYSRSFDGENVGPRAKVDLRGLDNGHFPVANVGGMYFDHDQGRIYYTVEGSSVWHYRYFTPESSVIGASTFEAPASTAVPWSNVRGMDRIDDHLYYGLTDGNLYRIDMAGNTPVPGTIVTLSGPAIDGRDWSDHALAFSADGQLFNPTPDRAEFDFSSTGSAGAGSWQVFTFPATAGEVIDVKLQWDDPAALMNVFLRDPLGTTVVSDGAPVGSPKWVQATAPFGGTWSVGVKIKEGATDFDVLVNPLETPPAQSAEHQFSADGCSSVNSFRKFKFPVTAGDQVDVSVQWDDPSAAMNAWLRDETNTMVVGDATSSGSPKPLSAVATSTGDWSVAVKIKAGCTSFDVFADSSGGDVPPPVAVASWALDGDFLDGVGSNHGTGVNAPVFSDLGGTCHYASFNGSNQFAEVPYQAELNPTDFTLSLWARPEAGTGWRALVSSRWEDTDRLDRQGYGLGVNGVQRWSSLTGQGDINHQQPGPNVVTDEWVHVAITFRQTGVDVDGTLVGEKKFYLNGSLTDKRTGYYRPNTIGALSIGAGGARGNVGNAQRFTGAIDEIHLFDRELGGGEINRVRNDKPGCSNP